MINRSISKTLQTGLVTLVAASSAFAREVNHVTGGGTVHASESHGGNSEHSHSSPNAPSALSDALFWSSVAVVSSTIAYCYIKARNALSGNRAQPTRADAYASSHASARDTMSGEAVHVHLYTVTQDPASDSTKPAENPKAQARQRHGFQYAGDSHSDDLHTSQADLGPTSTNAPR